MKAVFEIHKGVRITKWVFYDAVEVRSVGEIFYIVPRTVVFDMCCAMV